LDTEDQNQVKDITTLLYETALIQSGFDIEDITNFCKRIQSMIKVGIQAEDEVAPVDVQDMPKLDECKPTEDIDNVD
jgi:molecular chaperone HtpG